MDFNKIQRSLKYRLHMKNMHIYIKRTIQLIILFSFMLWSRLCLWVRRCEGRYLRHEVTWVDPRSPRIDPTQLALVVAVRAVKDVTRGQWLHTYWTAHTNTHTEESASNTHKYKQLFSKTSGIKYVLAVINLSPCYVFTF